ncbi:uncharacterized protein CEXT_639821 [Caerostris extrusa]|uniref:Uncharacterized protein n=1 Tax=Caerostris extrusa TaxID=172846 RepID=A0AAV4QFI5_CAEEX|nr:uncharacterized protein CEXT_639821 [Caerostris extrusa]
MDLVERIIENFHVTAPRSAKRQKLQSDCPLRLTARHFADLVPSTSSKKNASRKCIVCSKTKIRRETRYQFKVETDGSTCHTAGVNGLCEENSFEKDKLKMLCVSLEFGGGYAEGRCHITVGQSDQITTTE